MITIKYNFHSKTCNDKALHRKIYLNKTQIILKNSHKTANDFAKTKESVHKICENFKAHYRKISIEITHHYSNFLASHLRASPQGEYQITR